jgi:hypothetical protein
MEPAQTEYSGKICAGQKIYTAFLADDFIAYT